MNQPNSVHQKDRDQKIIQMYLSGLSVNKISQQTEFSLGIVNGVVCRAGISRPGKKLGRDLTGKRFGALIAKSVSHGHHSSGEKFWNCACDCGGSTVVRLSSLRDGDTRSCGCGIHRKTPSKNQKLSESASRQKRLTSA